MKPGVITTELWAPVASAIGTSQLAASVSPDWRVQSVWILCVTAMTCAFIFSRTTLKKPRTPPTQ